MNYLILVRHGQSTWNLEKRFTGWVDVELTEKGKQEARKSGELIKQLNIKIDHFFCSYQKRAFNTLELILMLFLYTNNSLANTKLIPATTSAKCITTSIPLVNSRQLS